jgi:hypothetical protein
MRRDKRTLIIVWLCLLVAFPAGSVLADWLARAWHNLPWQAGVWVGLSILGRLIIAA